tara:strand:+ start:967 stop:1143 length:177 start_codon:yes stop_codon:yes gene_type:complete
MKFPKYKKGSILQEYFLNPHFKPTPKEKKELKEFFEGFMETTINFEENAKKRLTKVVG